MKLSRNDLKSIVKECLLEILAEGMGSPMVESRMHRPIKGQQSTQPARQRKMDPVLDAPANVRRQAPQISTGNPVFDAILADTATTTLPAQTLAENSRHIQPVGAAERLVESSTPEQLFGDEASSKWATLAFSSVSKIS